MFDETPSGIITDIKPCRYTEVDTDTGNTADFFRLETIKVARGASPQWAMNAGTICARWVTDPPNHKLLSPMVGTVNGHEAPLGIQSHPDDLTITQVSFEEYVRFLYDFIQNQDKYFIQADTYDELEERIVTNWLGGVVVPDEEG